MNVSKIKRIAEKKARRKAIVKKVKRLSPENIEARALFSTLFGEDIINHKTEELMKT